MSLGAKFAGANDPNGRSVRPGPDAPITPPSFSETNATPFIGPSLRPSVIINFIVLGHVAWKGLHDLELPWGTTYGLKPAGT